MANVDSQTNRSHKMGSSVLVSANGMHKVHTAMISIHRAITRSLPMLHWVPVAREKYILVTEFDMANVDSHTNRGHKMCSSAMVSANGVHKVYTAMIRIHRAITRLLPMHHWVPVA